MSPADRPPLTSPHAGEPGQGEGPTTGGPHLERARELLAPVRLLALDVDGVLTDGRLVYQSDGETMVFDVQDGQGIRWLLEAGVLVAWISGRGCPATEVRAAELGVRELRVRVGDKGAALEEIQRAHRVPPDATAAMGDDLPDLALAARAAVFAAPSDAREEVRARAHLVMQAGGGRGAVRELSELILRAQDQWDPILARYRT